MPSTKKRRYIRTTKTTTSKRKNLVRTAKVSRRTKHIQRPKAQKGGILFREGMSADQAMEEFLAMCDAVTFFSSGSSGIIFRCTLPPDSDSPYTSYRIESYGQPVRSVILKFVAVKYLADIYHRNTWYCDALYTTQEVEFATSFKEEVNIQATIFKKTLDYLDPICPAPIYATIKRDPAVSIPMLDSLIAKASSDKTIECLKCIKKSISKNNIPAIGIIGMEVAEGYMTLHRYYRAPGVTFDDVRRVECMARDEILRLAMQTGYTQNDWHSGNILFNPSATGVYRGVRGKVMLLDFGYATKIPPEIIEDILGKISRQQYTSALDIFNTFVRRDGERIQDFPNAYGWLSNRWSNIHNRSGKLMEPKNINNVMSMLATRHFQAMMERKQKRFEDRLSLPTSEERDSMSLLPLDQADIKTRMFQKISEVVANVDHDASPDTSPDTSASASASASDI